MKKLIIVLMTTLLLVGCKGKPKGEPIFDMSKYHIESEQFLTMTMAESVNFLKSGTGYIYYGFDTCPWCLELIPVLDEMMKERDIKIYHVDIRPKGEDIRTDDNKSYMEVVDFVKEYLENDENGNPRLYVPQLFAVKDGKIMAAHADTVDGHNASERKMTDSELELLKIELDVFLNSIK